MPAYTLYYFNGRGRAEICRMLMAVAGVQYTDKRFEFSEWDKIKKDMPSCSVPVLEIDGKDKMPETMAIARYLAREFGFHGKTNMDMFRVDYICDCLYEIMHDYMRYFHEKNGRFQNANSGSDKSVSAEMQRNCMETLRRILPFLEKTLEMRNGGNQYFMGEQMTLCDMMCYCFLENPFMENQAIFSSYPKLMGLRNRVAAHPKVIGYLKKRSNTPW